MGLDTLNEFLPKDTDPISLGDDAIRETRAATKQSFGLEHTLDGQHKIKANTTALRPPAGIQGRLFWNTDYHWMEYDNGATWITPAMGKAPATILYHFGNLIVPAGATRWEIPFDTIITDPGGYAVPANHQIVVPNNVVGTAYLNLVTSAANGGFGGMANLEQWDGANWQPLAQCFNQGPLASFWDISAIANSGQGANFRCTFTNGTSSSITIQSTALGASPRFGFVVHGTNA